MLRLFSKGWRLTCKDSCADGWRAYLTSLQGWGANSSPVAQLDLFLVKQNRIKLSQERTWLHHGRYCTVEKQLSCAQVWCHQLF